MVRFIVLSLAARYVSVLFNAKDTKVVQLQYINNRYIIKKLL